MGIRETSGENLQDFGRGFVRIHETLGEDSQGFMRIHETLGEDSWGFVGICETGRGLHIAPKIC